MVRAHGCGPCGCGFESRHPPQMKQISLHNPAGASRNPSLVDSTSDKSVLDWCEEVPSGRGDSKREESTE